MKREVFLLTLSLLLIGCIESDYEVPTPTLTPKTTEQTSSPSQPEQTPTFPPTEMLSSIKVTPSAGEYFNFKGNKSKILLNDSHLSNDYITEDLCYFVWEKDAKLGDPCIQVGGYIKNEYDRDYWVCLSARSYDSEEEMLGSSMDLGAVCGVIRVYVESGETAYFELHLRYREDIEHIEVFVGCISEIMP